MSHILHFSRIQELLEQVGFYILENCAFFLHFKGWWELHWQQPGKPGTSEFSVSLFKEIWLIGMDNTAHWCELTPLSHCVILCKPLSTLWSQSLKVHQIPGLSHFPNVQFNTLHCTSNFPLEIKGKTNLFIKVSFWHSIIFNCSTQAPVTASNSVWEGWGSPKIPQQAGSTAAAELQMCSCWVRLAANRGEQRGRNWEGISCWVLWKWKMDIMDIKG